MKITIEDKFQQYIKTHFPDLNKYSFLNELLFYGIFIYYYYFGPINDTDQTFIIVKYIISIFIIRYILNLITSVKIHADNSDDLDNKYINYFQFNSKLAIVVIMLLFLSKVESNYTILLIIGYTLFISAINSGTGTSTVDNILTLIVIMYLYSLQLIT